MHLQFFNFIYFLVSDGGKKYKPNQNQNTTPPELLINFPSSKDFNHPLIS